LVSDIRNLELKNLDRLTIPRSFLAICQNDGLSSISLLFPLLRDEEQAISLVLMVIDGGAFIYERVEPKESPDGDDFRTFAFYATAWTGEPKNLEGGTVKWLTAAELTSKETGAFQNTMLRHWSDLESCIRK